MDVRVIKYPEYLVLSPVGNYMGEVLPDFIEACRNLDPKPTKIVLCLHADHPFDISMFEGDDIFIEINPEMFVPDKYPPRIETSMEILRLHFINNPIGARYALWLDTDVIIPPDTYSAMYRGLYSRNALVACNKVEGRDNIGYCCGPACMLTHIEACTLSRFFRALYEDEHGYIHTNDGKVWSTYSEDWVFFAIFDQCSGAFKSGKRKGRICQHFVDVEHRWRGLKERLSSKGESTYQMPGFQTYT